MLALRTWVRAPSIDGPLLGGAVRARPGDLRVAGACADGSAQLIDATTTSDTSDELWVAARATGRDSRANLRQNWLIRQSCLTPITKHEEWSALPR